MSQQTSLLSKINGIQRLGQDFDKKFVLKGYTAKRLTDEFPDKSWQSVVLINCWKSFGTEAQLTGEQAAADRAVPATIFHWRKYAMPSYA